MLHVYPLDEESQHNLTGTDCECMPAVDFDLPEALVVHNAFDGREIFEQLAEMED
jgi:hypothetical protein